MPVMEYRWRRSGSEWLHNVQYTENRDDKIRISIVNLGHGVRVVHRYNAFMSPIYCALYWSTSLVY